MADMTFLWNRDSSRGRQIRVKFIDEFDARGMKRVYGRCDRWGRGRIFNLDIWITREGRLLARFWAASGDAERESFEITGVSRQRLAELIEDEDSWISNRLRKEYENWTISNL